MAKTISEDITSVKKKRYNNITVFVLLISALIAMFFLLRPYLVTLVLSGIMAGLCSPMFNFFRRHSMSKNLSSSLTLIIFSLIIIFPLGFILSLIVDQTGNLIQLIQPFIQNLQENTNAVDKWNSIMPAFLQADAVLEMVTNLLKQVQGFIAGNIASFTSSAVRSFVLIFIFYYSMYFFLKDGRKILEKILYYIPMDTGNTQKIIDSFVTVSKATIKGTVIIGFVQ